MNNYYEACLFRNMVWLKQRLLANEAQLRQIHNVSGMHRERAELRERITAIKQVLSERELF